MVRVYVIFHIPRTGGTTIRDHLSAHLKLHEEFIRMGLLHDDAVGAGLQPFASRSEAARRIARVIQGHSVSRDLYELIGPSNAVRVTFLRHPGKRTVSCYNFAMALARASGCQPYPLFSFDDWLHDHITAIDFFLGVYCKRDFLRWTPEHRYREALRELREFEVVGLTETLDTTIEPILRDLEVPTLMQRANVTGLRGLKHLVAWTPELDRRLQHRFPYEYRLYEDFGGKLNAL